MISKILIFIIAVFTLVGCSSGGIKIHENHEELITFIKKGNIYNEEVFDKDFTFEGERDERIVFIGRSTGYFKSAEVTKADEDLKIKILNYVSNTAKLNKVGRINKKGRQIASNLTAKSHFENDGPTNDVNRKIKCLNYFEPQLDLTYSYKVDCRILFSAPKSYFQIDNN